jgi:ABC-2 type transport system ATP-binding protein
MIEIKNIAKSFERLKAVDDLSFVVKKGDVVGILGPNGAGKTTTMRIITGFLSSDKGSVLIDGIDIDKDPISAQKKIGYLPENNPLYKNMQVAEFLDLAADLHQIPATQKKEALDFVVKAVNIEKVFYRPVGDLSKGYKQRVGIAAALIHKPKVIILDEPTEGLDPNQRTEIRQLIKDLAKDHTIIMSTHVMQEASAVCNRIVIINKGKLVADGTADQLSQMSKTEKVFSMELEGRNIKEKLEKISQIKKLTVKKNDVDRLLVEIITEKDQDICPVISQLIWENMWIVRKLEEQEYKLEEIFQTLTKK